MFSLLIGSALAVAAVTILIIIVIHMATEPDIRIAPVNDIITHLNAQCECLPEILVSFGRTYEIHRPLHDLEPVDLERELAL